ncbi:VOC family protein [Desulfosoma caldarium]|uniref:Catechol 2,3-dioxygenase-like lactoylglutathione lyase family enzyme n=1 Tax=Desulfosoma caldarium TaxID=610254 RepID=A0A3N1VP00_9BACT|nr:VOC family protein [Desulfosoma caldarium]ROR01637.1 catechol 2,3-dioxygenase-like lactoylglutathione lyase family enzyme [Desulfosoma caldarium]
MKAVKYTGIHHLALVTQNMDQTIRFWRDLLGLPMVVAMGRPGYRHYFFALSEHDTVAFFEWPQSAPVPEKDHGVPVKGPIAFDHVSFGVADRHALWDLKARLEAAGFWASEVIDHGFILSLYAFDPNGIAIEFSYAVPDVDVRRAPRLVDPNPSAVTLEGPNPRPEAWPSPQPIPEEDRQVYPGEGEKLRDPQSLWQPR